MLHACMCACVHACVCVCDSIYQRLSCTAACRAFIQTSVLCAAPLPPLLHRSGKKKHLHLSLSAQALGKKKSLSDVAACSHSQNPSSSFSPSLILSSLPPSSSKLLSDKHTHTLLSCDPLAAPRLVSLIVACVQSGHKPRDQPK